MTEVHFVSNKKRPFSSQEQNTHEFELVFTQNHLFHKTQISSQETGEFVKVNHELLFEVFCCCMNVQGSIFF